MAFEYLTRTTLNLEDGNLATRESMPTGKSLLLWGTSQRGSMYAPVLVQNLADLEKIFGNPNVGTLQKAVYEALTATNKPFRLYAGRLGNGELASVDLYEPTVVSGLYQSTTDSAVTVTANEPGSIYNQFSLSITTMTGGNYLNVYNPILDKNYYGKLGSDGIKTNSDLVDFVNETAGVGTYLSAELNYRQTAEFEVAITNFSGMLGVTELTDFYEVDLYDFFTDNFTVHTSNQYMDDDDIVYLGGEGSSDKYALPITAFNLLHSDSGSKLDLLATKSSSSENFEAFGRNYVTASSVIKLKRNGYPFPISNDVMKFVQNNVFIGNGNGSTTDFTVDLKESLDTSSLVVYLTSPQGDKTTQTLTTNYTYSISGTELTISFVTVPLLDHVVSIDFESQNIPLVQVFTLNECLDSEDYTVYFITGKKIYFGDVLPFDIEFSSYRDSYIDSSDGYISNAYNGKIRIRKTSITSGSDAILFQWKYEPELVSLTPSKSLSGGTAGTDMTVEEKYDELDKALSNIYNFAVDIIVPVGFPVDEMKATYSEYTGKKITAVADYFGLVKKHLNERLNYIGQTFAIMAMSLPSAYDKDSVKDYLDSIIYDSSKVGTYSTLQTYINTLSTTNIGVCVGAPVILHNNVSAPYINTPEVIVGSLLAGLERNEVLTHETPVNVMADNLDLTLKQINTLVSHKYIPFGLYDGNLVVMSGDTFAGENSDYQRISTFDIIRMITNDLTKKLKPYYKNLEVSKNENELMRVDVDRVLASYVREGLVENGYTYSIYATRAEKKRGIRHIDISMTPAFELKNIIIKISLSLGQ